MRVGIQGDVSESIDNLLWKYLNSKHYMCAEAYIRTNEFLPNAMNLDYNNKDILGIIGAGDFLYSALFKGAKSITGVDVSLYACLLAELKHSGILNIDYHDFITFFGHGNIFDSKGEKDLKLSFNDSHINCLGFSESVYYKHLRNGISIQTQNFFDGIIGKVNSKGEPLVYDSLMTECSGLSIEAVPYLSSKANFLKTRKKLHKSNFPLFPIPIGMFNSEEKYDIIYLSNIFDCLPLDTLFDLLKPDGYILGFSPRRNLEIAEALPNELIFNTSKSFYGYAHCIQKK